MISEWNKVNKSVTIGAWRSRTLDNQDLGSFRSASSVSLSSSSSICFAWFPSLTDWYGWVRERNVGEANVTNHLGILETEPLVQPWVVYYVPVISGLFPLLSCSFVHSPPLVPLAPFRLLTPLVIIKKGAEQRGAEWINNEKWVNVNKQEGRRERKRTTNNHSLSIMPTSQPVRCLPLVQSLGSLGFFRSFATCVHLTIGSHSYLSY